jgi:hypothetical protein
MSGRASAYNVWTKGLIVLSLLDYGFSFEEILQIDITHQGGRYWLSNYGDADKDSLNASVVQIDMNEIKEELRY